MKARHEMSIPTGMPRRLLGQILLDGGFVTRDVLQAAIEQQRKTNAKIGQILVGMGALNQAELEEVLLVQRELVLQSDTVKVAAGVRDLLGEMLVRAKRLTPESLQDALAEQNRTGERLGRILVRRGIITAAERNVVLAFQKCLGSRKARSSPFCLGQIFVRSGAITSEKLKQALKQQKLSRRKIGEVLVESGYIKPEELHRGLHLQQRLLTAALIGMLALAAVPNAQAFDLPTSHSDRKMDISITAEVKARAGRNIQRNVPEVVLSNSDGNSTRPAEDIHLAMRGHNKAN